jgi:hypothetical protein
MGGDMALDKDDTMGQINPGGQIEHCYLTALLVQFRRVLGHGQGVQIDHTEDIVIFMLLRHPIFYRPQVIADMQISRRLDAGEDSFLVGLIVHKNS